MDNQVLDALRFAVTKHGNQMYGAYPYRVHLDDVMRNCVIMELNEDCEAIAALHDVLEDTDATLAEITALFGGKIAKAVYDLTRQENEDYFVYIERVSQNPVAACVKVCDLLANLERAYADQQHYGSLIARYKKALLTLLTAPTED